MNSPFKSRPPASVIIRCIITAACLTALLLSGRASAGEEAKNEEAATSKAAVAEKATAQGLKVPPSDTITKGEAQAVDRAGRESLDDPITCLARTIYWEARGSGVAEMEAVAAVVINRLRHEGFPSTICGIVKQGQEQGACQFSWWCDGRPDSVQDEKSYAVAKEVARRAINREVKDPTRGALYFHRKGLSPDWAKKYIRTFIGDDHVFYKPDGGEAK